jgi:hypothetical protein
MTLLAKHDISTNNKTNSLALIRENYIDRATTPVGEVSANFCG